MPIVILTPPVLPPNPCYANEQARANDYFNRAQASLPEGYTTVIVSQIAPGPDQRDVLWARVDGSGRFLGLYTFSNGQWQTINPTTPYLIPGEFRHYDTNLYTPVAPWFPCDGSIANATPPVPDLRGCFLVGTGLRVLPAGSTDTATNFTNGMTGGREGVIQTAGMVPTHPHGIIGVAGEGNNSGGGILPNSLFGTAPGFSGLITGPQGVDGNGVALPPSPTPVLPPYTAYPIMQWRPDLA